MMCIVNYFAGNCEMDITAASGTGTTATTATGTTAVATTNTTATISETAMCKILVADMSCNCAMASFPVNSKYS